MVLMLFYNNPCIPLHCALNNFKVWLALSLLSLPVSLFLSHIYTSSNYYSQGESEKERERESC